MDPSPHCQAFYYKRLSTNTVVTKTLTPTPSRLWRHLWTAPNEIIENECWSSKHPVPGITPTASYIFRNPHFWSECSCYLLHPIFTRGWPTPSLPHQGCHLALLNTHGEKIKCLMIFILFKKLNFLKLFMARFVLLNFVYGNPASHPLRVAIKPNPFSVFDFWGSNLTIFQLFVVNLQ